MLLADIVTFVAVGDYLVVTRLHLVIGKLAFVIGRDPLPFVARLPFIVGRQDCLLLQEQVQTSSC